MSTQPSAAPGAALPLQAHWRSVYQRKAQVETSWFREHLDESLRLIDALGLPLSAPVIDVGGGRSTLVDDLQARGFTDLTVLDLADEAMAESRARIGSRAAAVRWWCGDVTRLDLPASRFLLWHDRAVFHFMAEPGARARYAEQMASAVAPGGYAVIATFALDGPERCSNLPVQRYDAAGLAAEFGDSFMRVAEGRELHTTPSGATQPFTYVALQRHP